MTGMKKLPWLSCMSVVLVLGCGGVPVDPPDDGGANTRYSNGDANTVLSDGGANIDGGQGAKACITEVPCTTDLQCVGLPGTSCNTALVGPRCGREQCAPIAAPCSSHGLCATGLLCVDGTCRDARASAVDLCLAECEKATFSQFGNSNSSPCTAADKAAGCSRVCAGFPADGWWKDPCNGDLSRPASYGKISSLSCNKNNKRVCNASVYCRSPDGTLTERRYQLMSEEECYR